MENIETEYKYIIEKPAPELLESQAYYTESRITQIYLENPNATHRVRRREYDNGVVVYTENKKVRISKMSSEEYEREITEEEFKLLSKNIEKGSEPVLKTRKTFEYRGHIFEFDIYDKWKNTCIMEIELDYEDERIHYPPFIKILANVTGMREYSNHSMAHEFPKEITKVGE